MMESTLENEKARLKHLLAYKRLTRGEQEFCQACAVLMGKKEPVSVLLNYFKIVGLTLDGKEIDAARIKLLISNLEKMQLMDSASCAVNPLLQHTLLREALQGPRKKQYLEAWGLVKGGKVVFYPGPAEQKLQTAVQVYALAKDQVQEAQKIADSDYMNKAIDCIFSYYVNDPEWINRLPAPIQLCVYRYHFDCVWKKGAILPDFPSIFALAKTSCDKRTSNVLANLLVQHAVHSADLQLCASVKQCPATAEENNYALACFAFLRGEYTQAITLFDETLKLTKNRMGSRKYFLEGIEGIYYILALLQTQKPSHYPQIQEWLAWVREKNVTCFKPAFIALSALVSMLEQGSSKQEISFFHRMREENPINFALMWLCSYWTDRQRKIPPDKLREMFLLTKRCLPGIARILAELGAKMVSDATLYEEYLQQSGECYAISFLDIIPYNEDGETVLQLIPLEHGIKINLFVRPFGIEGPCFRPGQGFQTPQAFITGKSQRGYRNLIEERAEADRLIQSIPSLCLHDSGTDEWIFGQPNDALEALSEIHGYPHPIKILWPMGQKWHVSAPVNAKSLHLQITQERNWFALEGKLQINEEQMIELKQLLALVDSSDQRFLPIGDKQFLALTDHFKRQLRELKALTEQSQDGVWLHPLVSCALQDLFQEAGECQADNHWKLVKERILSSQAHNPAVPAALQTELRPYQIEGFQWLSRLARWGVGGCLADDMGLGKTLQALALILEQASLGPTLVVAPTSVCYNWVNEAKRFAPTLEVMLHAHHRKPEVIQALGPQQVLITSYGLLHLESELLAGVKWQTIILDEAQSIKNIHAKRSQAAQQLQGQVKMILTGTPLENRLSDLWNLFRFINPGLLGSHESFNTRFGEPIEQRKDPAARHALKKLIQPFVLRRLKTQVLAELPPRIEKTIVLPLTKEEKAFYEALRRTALEKLSSMCLHEKKRMHILAEIMRLRRACCHSGLVAPEIDIPSSKLTMLAELLEELKENNHRALVFSQFVGFLEKTRTLLDEKQVSYQYLDGSTPIDERMKRVNAFQKGEGDLFLISLKAGGTGLNLTGADFVIHLDPWWNPAVEDQASDRAHRMGQTRPVTIYRLIMEGTIEEKMLKLHEDKRGMAHDLLEGTDTSNKMTEDELLALLEL